MKKLVYIFIFFVVCFTHSIRASEETDTHEARDSEEITVYGAYIAPIKIGTLLRLLPLGRSHKPIKTPKWLPNFLNISPHNIREGILQAIKTGFRYAIINHHRDDDYSFFYNSNYRLRASACGYTGSCIQNNTYSTQAFGFFHSIPAAMIIEGFNGMMIDNSLNRGGRLVKQRIQQWEKSHSPLHPALKWSLIRAGRAAGSFAWACIIGTLRTLKNPNNNQWKLPSIPRLYYGVRLEITGIRRWKDVKVDLVVRA